MYFAYKFGGFSVGLNYFWFWFRGVLAHIAIDCITSQAISHAKLSLHRCFHWLKRVWNKCFFQSKDVTLFLLVQTCFIWIKCKKLNYIISALTVLNAVSFVLDYCHNSILQNNHRDSCPNENLKKKMMFFTQEFENEHTIVDQTNSSSRSEFPIFRAISPTNAGQFSLNNADNNLDNRILSNIVNQNQVSFFTRKYHEIIPKCNVMNKICVFFCSLPFIRR